MQTIKMYTLLINEFRKLTYLCFSTLKNILRYLLHMTKIYLSLAGAFKANPVFIMNSNMIIVEKHNFYKQKILQIEMTIPLFFFKD